MPSDAANAPQIISIFLSECCIGFGVVVQYYPMPLHCGNNQILLLFDDGFSSVLFESLQRNLSIAQIEMVEVCARKVEKEKLGQGTPERII